METGSTLAARFFVVDCRICFAKIVALMQRRGGETAYLLPFTWSIGISPHFAVLQSACDG